MVSLGLVACGGDDTGVDGFTDAEWVEVEKLSPLPDPPADPTNMYADDPAAAVLGQRLFFDKRMSGPILHMATVEQGALGAVGDEGRYGCDSCHDPRGSFIDTRSNPRATSLGAGVWLSRNTITMVNAVYYEWSGWQGFIDTYWGHSLVGIEAAAGGNGDRLRVAHLLWNKYRDEYNAIFDPDLPPELDEGHAEAARFPPTGKPKAATAPPGPWEGMTVADQDATTRILVNASKAINAYLRTLVRRDAPFDAYVAGDFGAINASAKRGLKLFVGKAACVECHAGPFFSDQKFHNVGVPQMGQFVGVMDNGRSQGITTIKGGLRQWTSGGPWTDASSGTKLDDLVATPADLGAFRTQALRNIADTAPYMHTGQFETLRSVIELYNEGGKPEGYQGDRDELILPLDLTESEIDDLVAFMESLTGAPLPEEKLQNTSAP